MENYVKISLEEFNEYVNLKNKEACISKHIENALFMSSLDVSDLRDMELKEFHIDRSDAQNDFLTFTFSLVKNDLRKKWDNDIIEDNSNE